MFSRGRWLVVFELLSGHRVGSVKVGKREGKQLQKEAQQSGTRGSFRLCIDFSFIDKRCTNMLVHGKVDPLAHPNHFRGQPRDPDPIQPRC